MHSKFFVFFFIFFNYLSTYFGIIKDSKFFLSLVCRHSDRSLFTIILLVFLIIDLHFAPSAFSEQKCLKKRKYLRCPMKVLALAVESPCDGHRKYVHFLGLFPYPNTVNLANFKRSCFVPELTNFTVALAFSPVPSSFRTVPMPNR